MGLFNFGQIPRQGVVAFLVFGLVGLGLIEGLRLTIQRESKAPLAENPQRRNTAKKEQPEPEQPKKHEQPKILKPTFFVTVGPAMRISSRDRLGELIAAFHKDDRYTIIPLNLSIYIRITNLQSTPRIVEKYAVEIKTDTGKWVKLIRIGSRAYDIYVIDPTAGLQGLKDATLSDLIRLDNVLSNRIEAQQNVQGWAFFEYPKEFGSEKFSRTYRLTISDDAGNTFTSEEMTPTADKSNESIQGALLRPIRKVDLSGASFQHIKD